ncbi:MAG: hypothetical protein ACLPYW_08885, partial [Acidimicrobiales bacterium]
DGQEVPDSKIRSVLKDSTDSGYRQKVWEASKGVGRSVEAELRELVKLRNEAAKPMALSVLVLVILLAAPPLIASLRRRRRLNRTGGTG